MQKTIFHNDWDELLAPAFQQPSYVELRKFLKDEYANETIYPTMENIWTAFQLTSFENVKVVILGQDPYHGPGQAHGLSFSVNPEVRIPPSLKNMFKELMTDIGCECPAQGTLTGWAEQGVLMLNTVLTVRKGEANSHRKKGWEQFTDTVIQTISEHHEHVVFILWGRPAQEKKTLIDLEKHTIVESVHPSPLSAHRGFFGSRPYSQTNEQLTKWGRTPINWCETVKRGE